MTLDLKPQNLFLTVAVHLSSTHPEMLVTNDPVGLHQEYEAIEKIHRFCHLIYNVPVTWLCSYAALNEHKETLSRFHRDYGDSVAIMESAIASESAFYGHTEKYQGWVEACGLTRPADGYVSKEPEAQFRSLHDMEYSEILTMLSYLKGYYDEAIGQDTRILATPWGSADTQRAMREVGLDVSWGYCWNYFCEGINHKGSLPHPFYINRTNHAVPEQEIDDKSVLAIHWGPFSPVIATSVEAQARMGQPGYCLNSLEMTNRSEGLDKYDFHRLVLEEYAKQTAYNKFVHIPLQLEAMWMDEGPDVPGYYDQFPTFNPSNTETFLTQIETSLRLGAKPLSMTDFADWHRENIKDSSEFIYYSEDHIPDAIGKGKDQPYQPMVMYAEKKHQFWFMKSRGFNYIRRYNYETIVPEKDVEFEYPFDNEPKVFLKIKSSQNIMAGISLTPESALYELAGFDLTAYSDQPDYAGILWQANLPSYIKDTDLQTGGAITGFRTIREKNAAILFADLNKGYNQMVFKSDLPNQHIRMKSVERVGRRFEIWIENDAEEVQLHTIKAKLTPGLRIGGFWWNGTYSKTIFRYGWGAYNSRTGDFNMTCFYPMTLTINNGLTRMSVEVL